MTVTTNYSFNLPTVNADTDTWGTKLDANWTSLDTDLKTVSDAANAAATTANAALVKTSNLSDLPNAATARINLGSQIGVDVQAYSAKLAALAALGTSGKGVYFSATNTPAELTYSTGLTLSAGVLTANVQSVAGRTGAVTLAMADITDLNTNAVNAGTMATRAVTIQSGGSPSGGSNGDFVFVY